MDQFYVDPYVDGEEGSGGRGAGASRARRSKKPVVTPAYSPSASPASSAGVSAPAETPSPSPSPHSSRARTTTCRHADSRGTAERTTSIGMTASSRSSPGVDMDVVAEASVAKRSPRATHRPTPYASPPRRPPTVMSPRTDLSSSPRITSTRWHPDVTLHNTCTGQREASDPLWSASATDEVAYSTPPAAAVDGPRSPRARTAAPAAPRTRGPGSRTVVPGSTRFEPYHRRPSSLNLTNAFTAATGDAEDGSAFSGTTVPSLFATMHARRRVRPDGTGSSATMASKRGPRAGTGGCEGSSALDATGRPSRTYSGGSAEGEEGEEIETLELPMQHYVAQSAYTMKNPFRTQDFAAFAANPSYANPPGVATYTDVPTSGDSLFFSQRANEGSFLIHRLVDLTMPVSEADRERVYTYLGRTLDVLQTGEWFLKWTRDNRIKQRFVWLNLQRGTLMWSSTAKQSLLDNSELKLSTVTDVKPDCIQDETTGRVFYRMQIRTPDLWKTFATEIREKFDMWFQALVELTRPNLTNGLPAVWGRPSATSNTNGRGVPGRWTARYSPLSAIAEGADMQLEMGGLPIERRTSSGD